MTDSVKNTIEALQRNLMDAMYAENSAEAVELVKKIISKGSVVGTGGSQTLIQTGIIRFLQNGDFEFLNRAKPGLKKEETEEILARSLTADVFLCSANAITENGELFNVDGLGNRISAICYGPKKVIVVAGVNKIVKNIEQAITRLRTEAAPKNAARLGCATPCNHTGICFAGENADINSVCDGCLSDDRICCNYLISGRQRIKNRISVIICNENLGY